MKIDRCLGKSYSRHDAWSICHWCWFMWYWFICDVTRSYETWLIYLWHHSRHVVCIYTCIYVYICIQRWYSKKETFHDMICRPFTEERVWIKFPIQMGYSMNKRGRLDSNSLGWTPGSFIWGTWLKLSRLNKCPMSMSRVKVMNIRGTKSVHTYEAWLVHIKNSYIHMTCSYQKSVHTY